MFAFPPPPPLPPSILACFTDPVPGYLSVLLRWWEERKGGVEELLRPLSIFVGFHSPQKVIVLNRTTVKSSTCHSTVWTVRVRGAPSTSDKPSYSTSHLLRCRERTPLRSIGMRPWAGPVSLSAPLVVEDGADR